MSSSPLLAQAAKKPFTIEDLYRLRGVGAPAMSPDGKTAVFPLTTSDLKEGKRTTNLWKVDVTGQNLARLTTSESSDDSPVFSPDGKTLAFISSRSGTPQLWLLPSAGGEGEKQTDFPGGIASPVFSPDGSKVAFMADVYPECGADAACNKKLLDAKEKNKVKAQLADRLFYRHWDSWKEGRRTHILLFDLKKEKKDPAAIVDLTPGDFDSPVFAAGGGVDYAFSPDGKEFAFSSNRDPEEARSTNSDILSVSLTGDIAANAKNAVNLTQANKAADGSPAFSPDGKYLAYRTQKVAGWESDTFRIVLLERATKKARVVTDSFDYTVTHIEWARDSKTVYFTAEVKGRTPIHALDIATGNIKALTSVGFLDGYQVSPDGAFAVVSRRRIHQPSEIWRLDFDPKSKAPELRLTKFNEAIENEIDIREAEEVSVPGADGKPVHMWIVKPHGFDPSKKYPLVLNIHGGPQQQWADSFRGDWQVYPGAGYIVAFPNPHGSSGFGTAYTAAISRDWNGKVMTDVEKVTDYLAALPYVDKDRMGAMGWSWGGYAVMWLAGHTERYKALASMMGVYDLKTMYSTTEELWFPEWDLGGKPWENTEHYAKASPSNYVTAFKTPTLVITGEKDFRVPFSQSLAFFTDLQVRKVPSRLLVFEKAGHWPAWNEMAVYYAAHLDWFQKYLGGGGSTLDPAAMVRGTAFSEKTEKAEKTEKK
jgi:dipeptidyl aminopeptidase/acylaminoacyl peptidase